MSRQVVCVHPDEELQIADNIMNLGRVRHMPVVDADGALLGIVTQRDLFRSALIRLLGFGSAMDERSLRGIRIKEVMTTNPRTTTPDTPLAKAAGEMCRYKVGCLPVLESGKVVGILTEGDFVAEFAET